MAESQQLTDQEEEQLALLYQNVTSQLETAKKRQWQALVFYSTVAAFLISQAGNIGQAGDIAWVIKILVATMMIIGGRQVLEIISQYQEKMEREREGLNKLYERFSDKFSDFRKSKGSVTDPDRFEIWFRQWSRNYVIAVAVLFMAIFLGNEVKTFFAFLCRVSWLQ